MLTVSPQLHIGPPESRAQWHCTSVRGGAERSLHPRGGRDSVPTQRRRRWIRSHPHWIARPDLARARDLAPLFPDLCGPSASTPAMHALGVW